MAQSHPTNGRARVCPDLCVRRKDHVLVIVRVWLEQILRCARHFVLGNQPAFQILVPVTGKRYNCSKYK